ncbi:NUDIX hydrolase [Halosimplex sp. TS25]|uniref:NUDIX hydrolase n=1 Tax=Halosimplex rarum TaxID=3396619 RepID=UPI0039ED28B9
MDLSRVRERDPVELAGDGSRAAASDRLTGEEREAAVLAPIVTRDGAEHVLFTKRAEHLSDHPGQMSFPGGGREPADADLLATALREGNEEIGLRAEEVEVVGRLDDIRTITDYLVRPFVVRVVDREYRPSDAEVAEVAVLPVDGLTDLDNYESERRDHPHYGEIRLHFFHVGGYTVWGATANMLVQLLDLTTDWELPPEPDHAVDADADLPG